MSAPVDVLAVMDVAAPHFPPLCEARAAVAELMRLTLAIDEECANAKPDFGRVVALASEAAAISRVSGGGR